MVLGSRHRMHAWAQVWPHFMLEMAISRLINLPTGVALMFEEYLAFANTLVNFSKLQQRGRVRQCLIKLNLGDRDNGSTFYLRQSSSDRF